MSNRKQQFKKIILSKINKQFGCWFWTGKLNAGGYGIFKLDKKEWNARRVSFELFHDQIIGTRTIRCTCGNPSCVNPRHLFIVKKRKGGMVKSIID